MACFVLYFDFQMQDAIFFFSFNTSNQPAAEAKAAEEEAEEIEETEEKEEEESILDEQLPPSRISLSISHHE